MSQQKTLWAGILIGLAVAAATAAVAVNWSALTAAGVAVTKQFQPTPTVTSTPMPTPTSLAEGICRSETAAWVTNMNRVVMQLLQIDDIPPIDREDFIHSTYTFVGSFSLPTCADENLRTLDTMLRSAVATYQNWNLAVINGKFVSAKKLRADADALLVLDSFSAFLEANSYIEARQLLQTEQSRIAAARALTPILTGNQRTLAVYKDCVRDVFRFRTQTDIIRKTVLSDIETLQIYAQGGTLEGFTAEGPKRFSASIQELEAPTCISEPTEILSQLRHSANMILASFVDVEAETKNGIPSAASRRRVRDRVADLKRSDRAMGGSYAAIPKSLARLLGNAGAGDPLSTADETTDDLPLNEYALTLEDFPEGVLLVKTSMRTNKEVAEQWDDPVTALANFERLGRIDSFSAQFKRANKTALRVAGADLLTIGITRTKIATTASDLFEFLQLGDTDFSPVKIPVEHVDQVSALKLMEDCVDNGVVVSCTTYKVFMRKGNIVAQFVGYAYTGRVDVAVITAYAQKLADRLNQ